MQIAGYNVSVFCADHFRLDGGAMFGSVPKTLWSKKIEADSSNRIQLTCRLLLLESDERKVLVDVGMGRKWGEKETAIFAIEHLVDLSDCEALKGVTDVIITHLHFDHAGGLTKLNADAELNADTGPSLTFPAALTFPEARHYVSSANLTRAKAPGVREKASYLAANIAPLNQAKLVEASDGDEILPGIKVFQAHGHTQGLQWVLLSDAENTLAYPSDLIPTAHHLSIPYVMGYDLCAETTMKEKEQFLKRAIEEDWIVVFEHDFHTAAGRVSKDAKGRYQLGESVDIPEASV